jgi:hypothetical protein
MGGTSSSDKETQDTLAKL